MKILITSYLRNKQQVNTCIGLTEFLIKDNINIDLFLIAEKKFLQEFNGYNLITDNDLNSSNKYDVILTYNKSGLNKAKQYAEKNKIPLIYLFDATEITKQYPDDFRLISRITLLNDYANTSKNILPKQLTENLCLPINLKRRKSFKIQNKKKPIIFIDIESNKDSSTLYSIIPLFNVQTNWEIIILLPSKIFPKVFNPNINIIRRDSVIAQELTKKADIIIGSGKVIENGVGNCKPCIIIGSQGYGGIVTRTNFTLQYKSNFQGRIGGELDEYIPEKLLMGDILDTLERGDEKVDVDIQENYNLLKQEYANTIKQINNLLKKEIQQQKILSGNIHVAKLKHSGIFQFVPLSKTHFIVINIVTRHKHSIMEIEEYKIVELFRKGNKVKGALKKSGYAEQPELFIEFIEELVKEKILVLDE